MGLKPQQVVSANILALFLCSLTWFLYTQIDHYRDTGPELLDNSLLESLSGWTPSSEVKSNQNPIDLSNGSADESHSIHQSLPTPVGRAVRLSADARLIGVTRGPDVWQTARIDLFGRASGGKWHWDFDNTLFSETGTKTFKGISRVILIPEPYTEIRVECELTGGTGTFIVERVSLIAVEERLLIRFLSGLLLICWLLFAVWVLRQLYRRKLWLPAITLVLTGILLLLIPESLKIWMLASLEQLVPGAVVFSPDHLLLFFAATLISLLYHDLWLTRLAPAVACLVTFSVATEVLQYYTSHRDPGVVDGLSNVVGIALAASAFLCWRFLKPQPTEHC